MDAMKEMGSFGAAMALVLSALGSMLGVHAAGAAAQGAWKRCRLEGRAASILMVAFVGAPLSQTIYGMILMNAIRAAPDSASAWFRIGLGVGGGLVIGSSAWVQGRLGAHAADAFGATGKDFAAHMMVLGVIETVALFMLVFGMRAVA